MIKLDYTLSTPEERNELVKKILEENPNPSNSYLEILADYLVLCLEKQEKKERKLLTENRMMTVNKRECSFEGLVSQLENGEDGIYNLIHEDKQTIFQPKITITKKDVEEVPFIAQIREAIKIAEQKLKQTSGKDAYTLKKAIIELRKDQYVVKNAYRRPIVPNKIIHSKSILRLDSEFKGMNNFGFPIISGITLTDPKICSIILCNYSKLKQDAWGEHTKDIWFLIEDFDNISAEVLDKYPLYRRIVEYKIDGLQNIEIQEKIEQEFEIKHSIEYISSLWRNKIPKLIASGAEDQFLEWYYREVEKGQYKKCSRCGETKLAHNKYFSLNKTSKDKFYSICKECRNKKAKKS